MSSAVNRPENTHKGLTTVNGVESDVLPVADRGTGYGHGLFETMLYSDGEVSLWQRHSSRLVGDAPVLGLNVTKQTLDDNLRHFLDLLKQHSLSSGIIKITVTAGTGGRGYASPAKLHLQIICQYSALPDNLEQPRREGVALTQCQYRLPINPVLAGIKHLNRLDQVLARAEWRSDDSSGDESSGVEYADGLMYSRDDLLIETTCANIFINTANNGWITPQLDQAGVRGVMRGLLLEQLFSSAGLRVSECAINRAQLDAATEIFICSSIRGLLPVTKINNLGQWSVGADTKRLQSALFDLYDCYPC
jgi:4-amino-4-deoxychorismate lyase